MRKAGEKFAHYEIRSLLGQGGMGEVYLAFDTKLHRRVALKLLLTSASTGEEAKADAVARIIREARAAAAVEHPNKVSIFELGEVDGTPYLAMEYIAGSTLRAFVGDASVDWKQKLGWLLDVARALDAAHEAGLVHRDIKPENVMVRKDGLVKVLDFGIARRADVAVDDAGATTPAIEALTGKGVVIGTAAYMPPEQIQGQDLDGRADQFAWGVMAFELLSGGHPWATNAGALAMVGAMLTKPAPPLEGFPEIVAGAVARALSAKREDRFGSMNEIVSLLAGVAAPSGPIAVVESGNAVGDADVASAPTDVAMARTEAAEKTPAPTPAPAASAKPAVTPGKPPRRWAWLAGVTAIGVALLAAAAWRFGGARPAVEHCLDTVTTSAGPRCDVSVSPETVGHRYRTMKLASGRFGVYEVTRLNTVGLPVVEDYQPARIEVRRGERGAVTDIVAFTQDGPEQWHEVWSDGGARIDYTEADRRTPRRRGEGSVTTVRREYDRHGFVRSERYFGPTGKPRPSEQGVFGKRLENDERGFALRETYLGADGEPMADRNGVAAVVRVANERGVEASSTHLDLAGNPIAVDGVATIRTAYTPELDGHEVTYFDAKGRKAAKLSYGTHGLRWARNVARRSIRTTFIDEDGKPRQAKGNAFASYDITRDERGRRVRESYFDPSGNPGFQNDGGAAFFAWDWDEHDHRVAFRILDHSGRPLPNREGFATMETVTDARGNEAEYRFLDPEGKLTHYVLGPPIATFTFDERGLIVVSEMLDGERRLALHSAGVAKSLRKHDLLRNMTELAFFGVDGKPILHVWGFSTIRETFDDGGDKLESAYFDAAGAPTLVDGRAKTRFKYDERGFSIEEAHLDTNDNPILAKDGFATVRRTLDRSGDVVEEAFFGKGGEPIVGVGGHAKKKDRYDIHRRRIETTLLDVKGAPVIGADGWAIRRIAHDERGLVIRESHHDRAGNPVVTKSGSATVTKKYDARGNVIDVATLGGDEKPVVAADGFAVKKTTYDDRDLPTEEALLGVDGAPVVGKSGWSVRKLRHDELGTLVDESFFDADRKPVIAKDPPYARKRDKYDARRRLVETTYFDAEGTPAKGPEGAVTIRYVRDVYGRASETAYFDAANAPTASKDGKIVVRSKYDGAGRLIGEIYVDAAGKSVAAKDGCMGRQTKYDELGRKVEESCVDDKGAPVVSTDGWASKRMLRDARGRVVEEATYGADGKLRADPDGIARRKHRYDERGLLLETTFWSADDKPAKNTSGAVTVRFKYDDAGKQLEDIAVDDKGKALPTAPAPSKP